MILRVNQIQRKRCDDGHHNHEACHVKDEPLPGRTTFFEVAPSRGEDKNKVYPNERCPGSNKGSCPIESPDCSFQMTITGIVALLMPTRIRSRNSGDNFVMCRVFPWVVVYLVARRVRDQDARLIHFFRFALSGAASISSVDSSIQRA